MVDRECLEGKQLRLHYSGTLDLNRNYNCYEANSALLVKQMLF